MSDMPKEKAGARICVLRYFDETVFFANIKGIESLGEWISWLAKSNPEEFFHFHLLWSLESEECKFKGVKPSNIWFLQEPKNARERGKITDGVKRVNFEVTFQIVIEEQLDELATYQESGVIPKKYLKEASSFEVCCN